MPSPKRASVKQPSGPEAGSPWIASRPQIPAAYGMPTGSKDLLPWSHVSERMAAATVYWVSTVSPEGQPHATPVDGLWLNDQLYFGGEARARRNRNLAANPAACIHLESGSDVVILHGGVSRLAAPPRELAVLLSQASAKKYGYGPRPEDYAATGVQVFKPTVVFAWASFPRDVTRWQFAAPGG